MYRKNNKYFLYLLPAMLIITIFVLYPIVNTVWLSFHDKGGNLSLDTYEYVLTNEKFQKSIINTLIFAFISMPLTLIISILISYLLTLKIKFKNTFQTIFFLPYVTSTIAIGAVWSLMYHSNYGIFNQIINFFGGESVGFLTDPKYALLSVIIFGIWKGLAFNILLLFTAISSIDDGLEKAAIVDGTKPFKIFWKIKLPQIYPIILYLMIIGLIHSLKVYEEIVSLYGANGAGPDNAAISLIYFTRDYITTDKTVAAVASIVLLILTLVLTIINRKSSAFFMRRSK